MSPRRLLRRPLPQYRPRRRGRSPFAGHRQASRKLLNTKMCQRRVPEKVLLGVRQEILRIWVVWHALDVTGITCIPVRRLPYEIARRVLAGPRWANWTEVQQPVEAHAQPDGPTFEPVFQSIVLGLEIVPLLRFISLPGSS